MNAATKSLLERIEALPPEKKATISSSESINGVSGSFESTGTLTHSRSCENCERTDRARCATFSIARWP